MTRQWPKRATTSAAEAARALRLVSDLTDPGRQYCGMQGVGDAGAVTRELLELTDRLTVVFAQLADYLPHEAAAGRIAAVRGPNLGDPDAAAAEAAELLAQAGALSSRLHATARWACAALGELAVGPESARQRPDGTGGRY